MIIWAKGGDPHNKKRIKYKGDGNKTQRKSKDEMAWTASDRERWFVMVKNVDTN